MAVTGETRGAAGAASSLVRGSVSPSPSPPAARAEAPRRYRGKNKQAAWARDPAAGVSVIQLPLVVADPADRARLERLYTAMWQIKRALRRDAANTVRAYWAGTGPRAIEPAAWREQLGLTRKGLEHRAYTHLDRAGHLSAHVTKALVMHQADEVWTGVSRHLFGDSSGRRAGVPRPGSWWDFTRITGRARSHTTARKWETFRLAGTLQGHLDAYRAPGLPRGLTVADAAGLPAGTSVLAQPRRLRAPARPTGRIPLTPDPRRSPETTSPETTAAERRGTAGKRAARTRTRSATWFDHTGPLALVFSGGATSCKDDLVLPVRLPQGAGRVLYLAHYLADPSRWHKIDLVRTRDASQPGGWAYTAHLTVLGPGHASTVTRERRALAATANRIGGVDGNVSNLAVVSLPTTANPDDGPIRSTRITLAPGELATLDRARRKTRGRAKALDRSRRATNPAQYGPSRGQAARAARRAAAGLPARHDTLPGGARRTVTPHTTTPDGVPDRGGSPRPAQPRPPRSPRPQQAYRRDTLSHSYQRLRARQTMAAAAAAHASRHRAQKIAGQLTRDHGNQFIVEDCDISGWFRLWGATLAATTPGRLIAALTAEAKTCGGSVLRAATRPTALSQHCLCGTRVSKPLVQRVHACPTCGLTGDRDLVSAALAAHITFTDPDDPATARVDYTAAARTRNVYPGLEEALTESTVTNALPATGTATTAARAPHRRTRRRGERASARRSAGTCGAPIPDESRPASAVPRPRRSDAYATRSVALRDSS